nr:ribonuclease H-like domain, reverse transcriptase, RNA-dependent DNA polymerase [Tanacetum cinerariifolium]
MAKKSSGAHTFIKPKQVTQALDDESWVETMQEESLQFRLQKDERGIVVRNKARLVAQGHRQEEGIDYDEVFAPVAKIEGIRIFLAFASYMGFIVYQMDVKSTFLYGTIEYEVYVSQPPGFIDPQFPNKVYNVEKALYGLHQALRAWCMLMILSLDPLKSLCVKQSEEGIFISQDKYVAEILKKFDCSSVKTTSTPIETQKLLVKDKEAADVDVHLYRSMIGSLMYLIASRLDIMFAVCACSRFQVTPKLSHLQAVKRIFRYLKGQPKLGLWYPKDSPFDLEAYLDSDYVGANLDRKSTTGGCQFLGRRLISWQCKKQTIVATSTTEAEYVAAANCYRQVLWIQNQMLDYVKMMNNVTRLQALFDKKKVIISEATIRDALRLNDVEGIDCLPNKEIFTELARMGYEKPSTKLTFYKAFFSSRNFNFSKYIFDILVRNVNSSTKFYMYLRFLQLMIKAQGGDLSSYTTKYSSPALTQKVFANMRRVRKGFSGVDTPLFKGMIVAQQADEGAAEVNVDDVPAVGVADEGVASVVDDTVPAAIDEPSIPSPTPPTQPPPPPPSQDLPSTSQVQPTPPPSPIAQPPSPQHQSQPSQDARISIDLLYNLLETCKTLTKRVENLEHDKIAQALEITKLKQRVKKLERRNKLKVSTLRRLKKVGTAQRVDTSDDTVLDDGRQAESQAQIYQINLEHANKVLSMQDDKVEPSELQEVVEVVTTAKLITEVVTAASATITAAAPQLTITVAPILTTAPSAARRRNGVVIRDPKEVATPSTIIHSKAKSKDKGKRILVEEPKPFRKQAQIEQDKACVRELEAELNKNIDWDEVIDQVKRKEKEDNAVIRYQALKRKPQTEAQARKNMMIYLRNVVGFKMDYFKGMTYDDIRLIFEKKFNSNVAFL